MRPPSPAIVAVVMLAGAATPWLAGDGAASASPVAPPPGPSAGSEVFSMRDLPAQPCAAGFSRDGARLAAALTDGTARLLDTIPARERLARP